MVTSSIGKFKNILLVTYIPVGLTKIISISLMVEKVKVKVDFNAGISWKLPLLSFDPYWSPLGLT